VFTTRTRYPGDGELGLDDESVSEAIVLASDVDGRAVAVVEGANPGQ
jgi:hypothetical protein